MNFCGSFSTPLGPFTVTTATDKVLTIQFGKKAPAKSRGPTIYIQAKRQIIQYARGERRRFQLPFELQGTDFQIKVWKAMERISFGKKKTYRQLAQQVRSPKAYRAVGGACHHNPLPLIIPCHRVLGEGGKLTGFAGGLSLKERLLQLEDIDYAR